ncbi:MAG: NAD(P)/FAD-dependent oxidoreductase [Byssovorax sp.]
MAPPHMFDALVVGAGPNGLSAAVALARAGLSVKVFEAKDTVGGGARSAELTLPGFVHDICSAIHPMGLGSPFLATLPLAEHGLAWVHPTSPLAHPLDDGTAAVLERSLDATGETLGPDAAAYTRLMGPLVAQAEVLFPELLGPLRLPRHPIAMTRFGLRAVRSAVGLANGYFQGPHAKALFAGCAAHSILPLERLLTSAIGLVLAMAGHAVGWPCARGGSQAIADALASYLRSLGGEIETARPVRTLADLPPARAILFDLTPKQILAITGDHFAAGYRRRLGRYRYGPAVFKVDWALDGPIPWKAPACARAATVHLGGTIDEIAEAEAAVWKGEHHARPYVLVAQQSLFDDTRAPAGKHTGWAYCHVPRGSTEDMTATIEAQMERFAPGFSDRILARATMNSVDFERHNENYVGGDITGGVTDLGQLFTRPVARIVPYSTPDPRLYLCSSSTPPGAGVHGMCGYFAAKAALRRVFGKDVEAPLPPR